MSKPLFSICCWNCESKISVLCRQLGHLDVKPFKCPVCGVSLSREIVARNKKNERDAVIRRSMGTPDWTW